MDGVGDVGDDVEEAKKIPREHHCYCLGGQGQIKVRVEFPFDPNEAKEAIDDAREPAEAGSTEQVFARVRQRRDDQGEEKKPPGPHPEFKHTPKAVHPENVEEQVEEAKGLQEAGMKKDRGD